MKNEHFFEVDSDVNYCKNLEEWCESIYDENGKLKRLADVYGDE